MKLFAIFAAIIAIFAVSAAASDAEPWKDVYGETKESWAKKPWLERGMTEQQYRHPTAGFVN